jgi:hypothetical protein
MARIIPKDHNNMHRHRRFPHRPSPFRPRFGGPFRGLFWLLPLALLFFGTGSRWGVGLLVIIGIALVLGAFLRGGHPPEPHEMPQVAPPPSPRYDPPPAEPVHRADLLPSKCPSCGAPVNANDVRWTGSRSASCSYCGANFPMKN